ncbi:hypothetical protein OJF2_23360 [Aquisphaera giovannonii]|uniref:Glycosyl transferase family 2 n=1 Tax=Aquisphaera giovannonii TaxID=406548 RepID=A0A5B9VZG6_9BACT|nr:hypothetical protein [Aquisphaera giovannonii]QEH33806.1 hypothetical protein OJF2_23360 [Aquisphaera giovannonii]
MDNSRCVVLVPAGRSIEPHCDFSLRQLEAAGYPVRRLYGFAQVDVARNRLASEALADGFEEMMWIDSDIAFEPAAVERLRSHRLPITCGLYPKKIEKAWSSQFAADQGTVTFGQEGGLVELRYAAGGFLHVRRPVFEEMDRQLALPRCLGPGGFATVPYFLPMVVPSGAGHVYLGEDFAFSERARRCGFRLLADTTIRLQHIGIYGYSWEDVCGGLPRLPSLKLDLGDLTR